MNTLLIILCCIAVPDTVRFDVSAWDMSAVIGIEGQYVVMQRTEPLTKTIAYQGFFSRLATQVNELAFIHVRYGGACYYGMKRVDTQARLIYRQIPCAVFIALDKRYTEAVARHRNAQPKRLEKL